MDLERLLISRSLRDVDLVTPVNARVQEDWFEDADARRVWAWILTYWREHSEVPTAKALKHEFPTFRLLASSEPMSYLIEEMRNRRRYDLLQTGLFESVELLQDGDATASLQAIQKAIAQLSVETAADVDTNVIETWESRMEGYYELRNLPDGMRGLPCGFPSIDRVLSGLQKQQLITLVGLPKSGKSTTVLKMAMSAHAYDAVILFIGFEMSNAEQEARHDAMLAKINHRKLLNGTLDDDEMDRLETVLKRRKSMQPFYLSSDVSSTSTLTGVAGKIEQFQPDLVIVDGVYMMRDEESGESNTALALTNITRGMKRLAQTKDIPIVMTTQALNWKVSKKRGLTSEGIGYSSSFLQDSDVVFGVESDDEADDLKKISVLDARSAPRMSIMIRWDWDTGEFSEEGEAEFGNEGLADDLAERMGYGE